MELARIYGVVVDFYGVVVDFPAVCGITHLTLVSLWFD